MKHFNSVLTILALVPAFTFSAQDRNNGGGYNGPTQITVSSPSEPDKMYTADQVKHAYNVCLFDHTQQDSFFNQMIFKIGLSAGDLKGLEYAFKASVTKGIFSSKRVFNNIYHSTSNNIQMISITNSILTENNIATYFSFRVDFDFQDRFNNRSQEEFYLKNRSFFGFKYEEIVASKVYDDFGRSDSGKTEIKNLQLVLPEGFEEMGENYPLYNTKTNHPTSFTINLKKVASCLLREVQK